MEERDDGNLAEDEIEEDSMDEECTKPKLPLAVPLYGERFSHTGFHRTARECLEQITRAMLHHRWQDAAEYIAHYTQVLYDRSKVKTQVVPEVIWRVSTEVLHHLPGSTLEDYINIYDRIRHFGVKRYLTISLEQVFHLLLHDQIDEARRRLTVAESWRYGTISAGQQQKMLLIQAYRSLLDYIIWCDKKSALASSKRGDVHKEFKIDRFFKQASMNLVEILSHPGVWDPFVLSYVEMLQFHENHEEAENVLVQYANDSSFPPNPNAQVYLYQFLLKQERRTRKIINVLKALHALVPSHELMLEFSRLLQESDDLAQALDVALDMLDFSCWSRNLNVWTRLRAVVDELQHHEGWEKVVADKMAARAEWWPVLHFTRFHATQDKDQFPELKEVKVRLLPVLFPDQKFKYSALVEEKSSDV